MDLEVLKARLAQLEKPKKVARYFTEYDEWQVERLLDRYLESRGLATYTSNKRGGYVIDCPAQETHGHRNRRDDCTLYTTSKPNGFIFISARCRHTSCGDALTEYCKALNQEWGEYLNEHYKP